MFSISLEEDNFIWDNNLYAIKKEEIRIWSESNFPKSLEKVFSIIPSIRKAKKLSEANFCFHFKEFYLIISKPNFDISNLKIGDKANRKIISSGVLSWMMFPDFMEIEHTVPLLEPLPLDNEVILDSPGGPIVASGQYWVYIGFPFEKSLWPDLPSFPVFWNFMFDKLEPDRGSFSYTTIDNSKFLKPGIYEDKIAVNFINEEESNNSGRNEIEFNISDNRIENAEQKIDISWIFILLSIVALLFLWIDFKPFFRKLKL